MARVAIILEDSPGGGIKAEFVYDPPLDITEDLRSKAAELSASLMDEMRSFAEDNNLTDTDFAISPSEDRFDRVVINMRSGPEEGI